MKRFFAGLAVVAMAAALATGCGDDDAPTTGGGGGSEDQQESTGGGSAIAADAADGAKGDVTLCLPKDVSGAFTKTVAAFNDEEHGRHGQAARAARVRRPAAQPARPALRGPVRRVRRDGHRHHLDGRVRQPGLGQGRHAGDRAAQGRVHPVHARDRALRGQVLGGAAQLQRRAAVLPHRPGAPRRRPRGRTSTRRPPPTTASPTRAPRTRASPATSSSCSTRPAERCSRRTASRRRSTRRRRGTRSTSWSAASRTELRRRPSSPAWRSSRAATFENGNAHVHAQLAVRLRHRPEVQESRASSRSRPCPASTASRAPACSEARTSRSPRSPTTRAQRSPS